MLIPLPSRVAVHVLDFGYLVDSSTGEPLRHLGRGTLRVSANFPEACTAHALPGRIAAHVSDLQLALDRNAQEQRGLLILPSYRLQNGELAGSHVTLQRVVLQPISEPAERPGDSTRTSAAVFDWKSFGRLAPEILTSAEGLLAAEPISDQLNAMQRLQISRPTIGLRARKTQCIEDLSPGALAMLAGIVDGELVRLGVNEFRNEEAFLSALADVLELLPDTLRGHISVSAGLTLPDQAIQIAWSECLTPTHHTTSVQRFFGSIDPKTALAEARLTLFGEPADRWTLLRELSAASCYAGEIISTRTDAGIMPQIRLFVSALARPRDTAALERTARSDGFSAFQTAVNLLVSKTTSGERQSLVAFAMKASPEERFWFARQCRRHGDAGIVTVAQLLCDENWGAIDLRGLGAAMLLLADAAGREVTRRYGNALATRIQGELAAFLRSRQLFTEDMLSAIVASDLLSTMTAATLAEESPSVTGRLLDSAAVIELLGADGRTLAASVRQRLVPREGKANNVLRNGTSDTDSRARALSALISTDPIKTGDASAHASVLASRLLKDGRRDIVVEAMRAISSRLSLRSEPDALATAAVERRQLGVLVALASVVEESLQPDRNVEVSRVKMPGQRSSF